MPDKNNSRFPIEEVAKFPAPGMTAPVSCAFSNDDRLVTYLHGEDQSPVRQLHALDIETGERRAILAGLDDESEELSIEEALRRQRQRQMGRGITRYSWVDSTGRILIPGQSAIYVMDGPDAPARTVVDGGDAPIIDPQLSADGTQIAYVQDSEVYVVSVDGGAPRQITSGARGTGKTHGLAEYIAQEEMGRGSGFWWSRDGSHIAFTEVDETHIPVYRIVHQGKDQVGEGAQEDHRYPFAGEANAIVRLGVVPVEGGEPVWMDLGDDYDIYLPRVNWMPNGELWAQIENREQTVLDLVRFDIATGAHSTVLRETSDIWINLHNMFHPLDSGEFIWASERTGFTHLYLHDGDGSLIRQLTDGDWMVDGLSGVAGLTGDAGLAAVDESNGQIYFTATKDSPTERHLYSVPLSGGAVQRITNEPGMHLVTIDHKFKNFVDSHSSIDVPPTITLRSLNDGSQIRTIHEPSDPRIDSLGLEPPELVTLQTDDGVTLHGAIYSPPSEFGDGPHPTIVYVYGGPHAQVVDNHWSMTASMRAQYLRSQGYLVFMLDNRGSARRGLAFEGVIKHQMGRIEVQDQVEGVRWLVDQGLADPERVGIYGWSYGGFMTLLCLAQASDVFKMGVVGAPTVHWDGYDTHYTERYMGTPQSNPDGYANSSPVNHVQNIKGNMLLVHGLIDENVHFRHTARLINALIANRIPYEFMLFPDERHMPRQLGDRVYMEERITEFIQRNL